MLRVCLLTGLALVLLVSGGLPPAPAAAQSQPAQTGESYAGQPLCLPESYSQGTVECAEYGPAAFYRDLARKGIELPLSPLPALAVDPTYKRAPLDYLKVSEKAFPVYDSLDAAVAGKSWRKLPAGMKYLAISERVELNTIIYYHLTSGDWIEAGEAGAACCIADMRFAGQVFRHNPRNRFGWVVNTAVTRAAPGYAAAETGRHYSRETLLQIYDARQVGSDLWYMVGVQEWVEARTLRVVSFDPTPPPGVDNNRWIDVNLADQTLAVYENGQLVFATLISSGMKPFFTRPGLFHIQQKLDVTTMKGSFNYDGSDDYYLEDVPWTMYFDGARALHGAYWRTLFGYPQSHGCVNLSLADARWLYEWAVEGDWVYVHDPSGKTPTDPAFYGKGGA